ncbi:MAG: ParB/RepB/Spo0J family partition protein [Steroidobacteraceae bacterium]
MIQKKPSLGRGLEALIGPAGGRSTGAAGTGNASGAAATAGAAIAADVAGAPGVASDGSAADRAAAATELAMLPLDRLQRGRYQPRLDMRPESLQELADSIRAQGVVQPIVVRPIAGAPPAEQRYEIIAGERRWRAAQMAGLAEIPAVVRYIPDEAAIAVALIENIQRENLNALEEARALDRLIGEFHMTHQQAADAVGRSRAAVSNLLRLLELAPEIAELVERRELEMGHARALLGLPGRRQQVEVGGFVAKKHLSVRETEAIVRKMLGSAKPAGASGGLGESGGRGGALGESGDPDVRRLEQELAEKLGAKVAIRHASSGKGRLTVDYNSLDELDGILAHIQ